MGPGWEGNWCGKFDFAGDTISIPGLEISLCNKRVDGYGAFAPRLYEIDRALEKVGTRFGSGQDQSPTGCACQYGKGP